MVGIILNTHHIIICFLIFFVSLSITTFCDSGWFYGPVSGHYEWKSKTMCTLSYHAKLDHRHVYYYQLGAIMKT